jgi:hypothetical protein
MPKVFPRQKICLKEVMEIIRSYKREAKGVFTSQYVGVMWHRTKKRWRASISVDGSKKTLGYFDTEVGCSIGLQPSGLKAWTANEHH